MTEQRPSGYYQFARDDIAALTPPGVLRVLDVGCATGRLGAGLKARGECEVYGLEIEPGAADQARQVLDHVVVGDVETLDLPFPDEFFDCIIYADVLEHLRDPRQVLVRHSRHLSPNGWLLASVPNVRSYGVLLPLILRGVWRYTAAGILDETHLRFFTRRTLHDMLKAAGYTPSRTVYNVPGGRRLHITLRLLREAPAVQIVDRLTLGLLREFLAVQILVLAQKTR